MTHRYGIRAAKYALQLLILLLVFYSVLRLVGYDKAPLEVLWMSPRGLLLIGAIVVFSLLYPFLGYTKKTLTFDLYKRLEDVERVMGMCGYVKDTQNCNELTFRASTTSKRLSLGFEDTITITTTDGVSVMQGPRKEVVKIYFRMGTFIG